MGTMLSICIVILTITFLPEVVEKVKTITRGIINKLTGWKG